MAIYAEWRTQCDTCGTFLGGRAAACTVEYQAWAACERAGWAMRDGGLRCRECNETLGEPVPEETAEG